MSTSSVNSVPQARRTDAAPASAARPKLAWLVKFYFLICAAQFFIGLIVGATRALH